MIIMGAWIFENLKDKQTNALEILKTTTEKIEHAKNRTY